MSSMSPMEKIAEKVADMAPGLAAVAKVVGVEDHRRMLRDHARRVRDSHKMMAQAVGMGDVVEQSPDDDMGDIFVTGDIHWSGQTAPQLPWSKDQPQQSPPPSTPDQPPEPTEPKPEEPSLLSRIAKPAAIAAGTMAAGGIGAAAVNALWPEGEEPPAVVQPAPERPQIALPDAQPVEPGRVRVEVKPYQPE